ncbi:hypothetical protein D3C76_1869910 [compost metagenome]
MDINHEEKVFPQEVHKVLMELVRLRKPLVQDYYDWDRQALHSLTPVLPDVLEQFAGNVREYLKNELY